MAFTARRAPAQSAASPKDLPSRQAARTASNRSSRAAASGPVAAPCGWLCSTPRGLGAHAPPRDRGVVPVQPPSASPARLTAPPGASILVSMFLQNHGINRWSLPMRTLFILAMAVLVPWTTASAQERSKPRAFQPEDWYRVTTVSSPAMSPDGKLVAFTVTTVKEAENRRHSEIWVVPTAGGEPVRYTAPGYSSSNPRFSHDGKYLFFTSNRPGGKGNRWALRMDQPGGEAFQVDDYPTGSVPRDGRFAVWAEPAPRQEQGDTAAPGGRRGGPGANRGPAASRPPYGAITKPLDQSRFDGRHYVDLPIKSNNA